MKELMSGEFMERTEVTGVGKSKSEMERPSSGCRRGIADVRTFRVSRVRV